MEFEIKSRGYFSNQIYEFTLQFELLKVFVHCDLSIKTNRMRILNQTQKKSTPPLCCLDENQINEDYLYYFGWKQMSEIFHAKNVK